MSYWDDELTRMEAKYAGNDDVKKLVQHCVMLRLGIAECTAYTVQGEWFRPVWANEILETGNEQ